jgi:hypothetical protein
MSVTVARALASSKGLPVAGRGTAGASVLRWQSLCPAVTGDAGTNGAAAADRASAALVAAGAVLIVVLVALVGALLVGGETGALVAIGALSVLFAAVGFGLFLIARKVGSQADDPEEVERRMAESLGLSEERTQLRVDRVAGEAETAPSQAALDERYEDDDEAQRALDERFYNDGEE